MLIARLSGLISLCAFLTILFSIITLFDVYHQYIELFSHFRLQYLASSCLLFFLLILIKKPYWSTLMGGVCLLNAYLIYPWYFNSVDFEASPISKEVKILHANVLSQNTSYHFLSNLVESENPDILFLQETSSGWRSQIQLLEKHYPFQKLAIQNDNFGIAALSKIPFQEVSVKYWGPKNIPSLKISMQIGQKKLSIISTHPLPPLPLAGYEARNNQLKTMANEIGSDHNNLIIIGDLNISMWSAHFKSLILETDLIDARHGFGLLPSWPTYFPLAMIPIDHCLVSQSITVSSIKTGENIGSDHLPLIVTISI